MGVGAVFQDRRKVGGDLSPESVLPAVAIEVVEEDRSGRCRVLEEYILVRAVAQGDGMGTGTPLTEGVDHEVRGLSYGQGLKAAGSFLELGAAQLKGLGSKAVVDHDRD